MISTNYYVHTLFEQQLKQLSIVNVPKLADLSVSVTIIYNSLVSVSSDKILEISLLQVENQNYPVCNSALGVGLWSNGYNFDNLGIIDAYSCAQSKPVATSLPNGDIIIAFWNSHDNAGGYSPGKISAVRYIAESNSLGTVFDINAQQDGMGSSSKGSFATSIELSSLDITSFDNGNYLVCWTKKEFLIAYGLYTDGGYTIAVKAQLFDSRDNRLLSEDITLNSEFTRQNQGQSFNSAIIHPYYTHPSVDALNNNKFLFVYHTLDSIMHVKTCTISDASASILCDTSDSYSDPIFGGKLYVQTISFLASPVLIWENLDEKQNRQIYVKLNALDSSSIKFAVSASDKNSININPAVALTPDGTEMYIVWQRSDTENGEGVYIQGYNSALDKIYDTFSLVNNCSYESVDKNILDVSNYNGPSICINDLIEINLPDSQLCYYNLPSEGSVLSSVAHTSPSKNGDIVHALMTFSGIVGIGILGYVGYYYFPPLSVFKHTNDMTAGIQMTENTHLLSGVTTLGSYIQTETGV
jgi:hypothetical protein